MKVLNFRCLKKILARLNKICIDVICYQNKLTQLVYISDQDLENCIDLLLISEENKLHYVSIKDYVQ